MNLREHSNLQTLSTKEWKMLTNLPCSELKIQIKFFVNELEKK